MRVALSFCVVESWGVFVCWSQGEAPSIYLLWNACQKRSWSTSFPDWSHWKIAFQTFLASVALGLRPLTQHAFGRFWPRVAICPLVAIVAMPSDLSSNAIFKLEKQRRTKQIDSLSNWERDLRGATVWLTSENNFQQTLLHGVSSITKSPVGNIGPYYIWPVGEDEWKL